MVLDFLFGSFDEGPVKRSNALPGRFIQAALPARASGRLFTNAFKSSALINVRVPAFTARSLPRRIASKREVRPMPVRRVTSAIVME
jgi:hypothetical protein